MTNQNSSGSRGSQGGGSRGGGNQGGRGQGKGGGWPSTNHNPSGGGRSNNLPGGKR